jgi:hypothetical protein
VSTATDTWQTIAAALGTTREVLWTVNGSVTAQGRPVYRPLTDREVLHIPLAS